MNFLEILYSEINRAGINRNKLLAALGMDKNAIFNWETRGTIPSGDVLSKLADYFGVSVDYLLGRASRPSPGSLDFGYLREYREAANISLVQLASITGVPVRSLSEIESGKSDPPISTVAAIADKIGCSIEHLIGYLWEPETSDSLSPDEHTVINAYRNHKDTRSAIQAVLRLSPDFPDKTAEEPA